MPITVLDIKLHWHRSCFYVDGVSNPRNFSKESLIRKGWDTELDFSSFRHTGHILFGDRNQESRKRDVFSTRTRGTPTPEPLAGPTSAPG